ncbi:hypothetical protein AAC387_Pa10g2046 [Persea americana]
MGLSIFNHSNYKIVYVSPMKSLVAEVVGNLSYRLRHYGVNVNELSGDQTSSHQQIDETQIIITTPEKWDIIARKSGDRTYTQLVKLLIIDEIHFLHDNRGPVLESIIAGLLDKLRPQKSTSVWWGFQQHFQTTKMWPVFYTLMIRKACSILRIAKDHNLFINSILESQ